MSIHNPLKIEIDLPATDEERTLRANELEQRRRVAAFQEDYEALVRKHGLMIEVSEWAYVTEVQPDEDFLAQITWKLT